MNEIKKISVSEVVKRYNTFSSDELKKKYVQSLIIQDKYVDYLVKVKYAQDIITISSLDNNGKIKFNSSKKYMLYVSAILNLYTKIDISSKESVKDFDMLDKYNLIDEILDTVPQDELSKFDTVMKMCTDDFIANNYEIHSFINKQIDKVTELLSKNMTPIIHELSEKINDFSVDDFKDIVTEMLKE